MTNQELFLVFGGIVTCYAGYLFLKLIYNQKIALKQLAKELWLC